MKLKLNLNRGFKSITRKFVKNKNTIMFITGGVSVLAGEVSLAMSYAKNKKEFEEYKNSLNQYQKDIDDASEEEELPIPSEEDIRKVKKLATTQMVCTVSKNMVVPVVLNVVGFYFMGRGYCNVQKALTEITAALLISENKRKRLLDNVKNKYGELETAVLNEDLIEVKDENGKIVNYTLNKDQLSNNEFIFDERSEEFTKDANLNRNILEQKQKYWNDQVFLNGYVTQNEVTKNLGVPGGNTCYGLIHGWAYDGKPKHVQIDFGLNDICNKAFMEGKTPVCKIRLNSVYLGDDAVAMDRANMTIDERAMALAEENEKKN